MNKRIHRGKCVVTAILLLALNATGFAQKSLVSEQWQKRMIELIPEVKPEFEKHFDPNWLKESGVDFTREDLLNNATYTPIAYFVLDYDSYLYLTPESNLLELIKLDTMRIAYYIFNKRTNKYVMKDQVKFSDGKWVWASSGLYGQQGHDYLTKLYAANIPFYLLRTSNDPEHRAYRFSIENGQMILATQGGDEGMAMLDYLIRKRDEAISSYYRPDGYKYVFSSPEAQKTQKLTDSLFLKLKDLNPALYERILVEKRKNGH